MPSSLTLFRINHSWWQEPAQFGASLFCSLKPDQLMYLSANGYKLVRLRPRPTEYEILRHITPTVKRRCTELHIWRSIDKLLGYEAQRAGKVLWCLLMSVSVWKRQALGWIPKSTMRSLAGANTTCRYRPRGSDLNALQHQICWWRTDLLQMFQKANVGRSCSITSSIPYRSQCFFPQTLPFRPEKFSWLIRDGCG